MSDKTGKPRRIGVEESIAVKWSIAEVLRKATNGPSIVAAGHHHESFAATVPRLQHDTT